MDPTISRLVGGLMNDNATSKNNTGNLFSSITTIIAQPTANQRNQKPFQKSNLLLQTANQVFWRNGAPRAGAKCSVRSIVSSLGHQSSIFSQKIDYLKDKVQPSFVKERRAMKREYEEFKVRINALVVKAQKKPEEGWTIQDGTPWPL